MAKREVLIFILLSTVSFPGKGESLKIDGYIKANRSSLTSDGKYIIKLSWTSRFTLGATYFYRRNVVNYEDELMLAPKLTMNNFTMLSFIYFKDDKIRNSEFKGMIKIPQFERLNVVLGILKDHREGKKEYYAGFIKGYRFPKSGYGFGLWKNNGKVELRGQVWSMITDLPIFVGLRKADGKFLFVISKPSINGTAARSVIFYSESHKKISFFDFILGGESRNGYYSLSPLDSWYFLHDSKLVGEDCMSNGSMSPYQYLIPPIAWRITKWGIGLRKVGESYNFQVVKYIKQSEKYVGLEMFTSQAKNYKVGVYIGMVKKDYKFHFEIQKRKLNYEFNFFLRLWG